jgi:outer membrane protein assembly factor BamB
MNDTFTRIALASSAVPASPLGEPRPRLWPGAVLVALQWLAILIPVWLDLGIMFRFTPIVFGPFVTTLAVTGWWLFGSNLRWADRGLVVLALATLGVVAFLLADPSVGVFGLSLTLRILTTLWIGWLLATPFLRWPVRRAGLLALFLLVWVGFTLVRRDGVDGSLVVSLHPRWSQTAEDRFLAELGTRARPIVDSAAAAPLVLQPGDWPGFRGPVRDGRVTGVHIATDWQQHPPRQVWRQRVGPGWSSFAVVGTRLFTQEQRGPEEAVVCYDANSGKELWAHGDPARLVEEQSGVGPRGTPTFHEGKLYTLGATGRLNCLDAATGGVLWSHDITADAQAEVPRWGFSSSPLVAGGVVTVFAGGPDGKAVLGYHADLGKMAWTAGSGQGSYSSPHLARLGGTEHVVIATDAGLTALDPVRGKVLWRHDCPAPGPTCVVQPALLGDADVLLGNGTFGIRRLRVNRQATGWAVREVSKTRTLKPFFNDLVVHQDHLYGFDIHAFTCVGLEDGRMKWRARGYGNGQVLLLADQDLLLVLTEEGEVVLLAADPAAHRELGRFQALDGKTWNHPVVAHGKLFVRNSEEAACYQLVEISDGGLVDGRANGKAP